MLTELEAIHAVFERVCLYAGCGGLAVLGVVCAFRAFAPVWEKVWSDWLRLDGLGKVICTVCVCAAAMYGGSKNAGWNAVQNHGGDTAFGVVLIETQGTNAVETVGGVVTTNAMTWVQAHYTGSGVTNGTPIWVRNSSSNEWTQVVLANSAVTVDLSTNVYSGVASGDLSAWKYWWLGVDLPAVEIDIETLGINLLQVTETAQSMGFLFTCDDDRATAWKVQYKRGNASAWETAATGAMATTNAVGVSGFWVGETTAWRIASEIGGEDE